MRHRSILVLLAVLCFTRPLQAGMFRVTGIVDGRTISVDAGGQREVLRLTGVEVTDEAAARDLLRWTLLSRWVLSERDADGNWKVWRSPDVLFVNRELVMRGYARATRPGILPESTLMVTYLGVVNPSGPPKASKAAAAPENSSGTSRRSSTSSPRRSPPRRAPAKGH